MTVFVLELKSPRVLLILSDAGSSLSFSRIQRAPGLVDLKRFSYNNQTTVKVLCIIFNSAQRYKLVYVLACEQLRKHRQGDAMLSSVLLHSNRITLQTPVYRVFNHAIWPIKMRHSHSLCAKIEFIRHLTRVCLFWSSQSALL